MRTKILPVLLNVLNHHANEQFAGVNAIKIWKQNRYASHAETIFNL